MKRGIDLLRRTAPGVEYDRQQLRGLREKVHARAATGVASEGPSRTGERVVASIGYGAVAVASQAGHHPSPARAETAGTAVRGSLLLLLARARDAILYVFVDLEEGRQVERI